MKKSLTNYRKHYRLRLVGLRGFIDTAELDSTAQKKDGMRRQGKGCPVCLGAEFVQFLAALAFLPWSI